VFIRLFQSSSQGSESCAFFQGASSLPEDSLDSTDEPHPRFLVQGHVVSVGGDALIEHLHPKTVNNSFIFNERGCLPAWGGDSLRPVQTLRRYIPPAPSPSSSPGHPPMRSVQASLLGHAWFSVGFEQCSKKLK